MKGYDHFGLFISVLLAHEPPDTNFQKLRNSTKFRDLCQLELDMFLSISIHQFEKSDIEKYFKR